MKLSLVERWILVNQLQILEYVTPDDEEKERLAYKRKALEGGYEIGNEPFQNLTPDDEVVTYDECREVLDILSMFRAIDNSLRALGDTKDLNIEALRFRGFDGNDEIKQYSFAQYFCIENPQKPFIESFPDGKMTNTHSPVLDVYRRMMRAWHESKDKNRLTNDDLLRIIKSQAYPRG